MHDGSLLAGWQRPLGPAAGIDLQFYYDHAELNDLRVNNRRDTFDFELEHHFVPEDRHTIVWGLGYRVSRSDTDNSFYISLSPSSKTDQLASAFVQDTIALVPNALALTVGSKFEYNSYTNFEVQPSGRIAWQPGPSTTVWGAISHAVRTPSEAENDLRLNQQVIAPFGPGNPTPFPAIVAIFGQTDPTAERLNAFELGTRFSASERLSFDIAAYYNQYDDLVSVSQGAGFLETTPGPAHLVVPLFIRNQIDGHTYGIEAVANWKPHPNWRLQFSYSYINFDLNLAPGVTPTNSLSTATGQSPQHQFKIRSLSNLTDRLTLDTMLRYVARLPAVDVSGYFGLDARLGYRIAPGAEVALVGRNLLYAHRFEFGPETTLVTVPTQVDRSVFVTLKLKF